MLCNVSFFILKFFLFLLRYLASNIMFLSILIPTHNCECVSLCMWLSKRIAAESLDAEVIVMDDASTDIQILEKNRRINDLEFCKVVELKDNIGIAKNRNHLADVAKGDYLLFLDADVFPVENDFLKKYIDKRGDDGVLCGGMTFRLDGPVKMSPLRFKYGMKYEVKQPQFISLNFFLHSSVFKKVRFNESFSKYGHEDTQFGADLQKAGYRIQKIDNPVYHDNGDTSEQFLKKTRVAIDNLVEHRDLLLPTSRLLQLHEKLRKYPICWLMRFPFRHCRSMMERNLLSDEPSLTIYNIYRLSYLFVKNQKENL